MTAAVMPFAPALVVVDISLADGQELQVAPCITDVLS